MCFSGFPNTSYNGADNRMRPSVALKDSSSPALTQLNGFHATSTRSAAARAVSKSFSRFSQKDAAQNTSRITARTTEGENPVMAA